MKITLDAMLRRASRMVEPMFNEEGTILMLWLLEKADGEQIKLTTPVFANDDDEAAMVKNAIASGMREFFREHDIQRYVQIFEGWTVPASADRRSDVRPTYHPQRQEIVMLCADDGREHVMATRAIIRPSTGKPYLGKLSAIERSDGSSRFYDLLPRRGAGSA